MRLAAASLLVLVGCQQYQFEPVQPVLIQTDTLVVELQPILKPNVMLAVDRSGSMRTSVSSDAACAGCATGVCPATCPTRLSDLKQAVSTFTTLAAGDVRLGLTVFPEETTMVGAAASCVGASSTRVSLPVPSLVDDAQATLANRQTAQQVNAAVQLLTPNGGTPTAATLRFLSTVGGLTNSRDFRPDYVVLLTDGLPNCNERNPNDYEVDAAQCRCLTSGGDCSGPDFRRRGCLDADGTVAEVAALRAKGVKTIVIGFGAETNQADARQVLTALATAGGAGPAFQAANRAELERVLAKVLEDVRSAQCQYTLDAEPIPGAITLTVDDRAFAQGADTWTLSGRQVTLAPAFCDANTGATLRVRIASAR